MSGIKGNSSNEQVLKSVNQFTGLANLNVVAINPNKEQLQKLLPNADIKEEPKYTDIVLQEGNDAVNKIVFYLSGNVSALDKAGKTVTETIISRVEFIVNPKERVSQTGKNQWINSLGVSTWNSPEEIEANTRMAWANKPPFKKALIGEDKVLDFVKNWLNVDPKTECNFKDSAKLMSGDVTELREYLKSFPKNQVTVYLDVTERDGKYYQVVYNKAFSRPTAKTPEQIFAKSFQEDYGAPKTPFKSFDLRVYYPSVSVDTPDTEQQAQKENDFV